MTIFSEIAFSWNQSQQVDIIQTTQNRIFSREINWVEFSQLQFYLFFREIKVIVFKPLEIIIFTWNYFQLFFREIIHYVW